MKLTLTVLTVITGWAVTGSGCIICIRANTIIKAWLVRTGVRYSIFFSDFYSKISAI